MRRWIGLLLLGCAALGRADPPPIESLEPPRFAAELLLFHDEGLSDALLWIVVRVPFGSLYFDPALSRAVVRLTWKVSQGGRQLVGDVIERRIDGGGPEDGGALALLQALPVRLGAGKYDVEVSLSQPQTDRTASVERAVRVRPIAEESLVVSSLYLSGRGHEPNASPHGRLAPLPLVTRLIGMDVGELHVVGELYAPSGCPESFKAEMRLVDEWERTVQGESKSLICNGFKTPFDIPVEVSALVFGEYRIEITLSAEGRRGRVEREIWFAVDETRLPMREHFDRTVDLVRPIATREEIEALASALPSEREAAWESFWKSRDPNPASPRNEFREEYFRRVRFANEHFGSPFVPGWKSDRGQIYLRHGPPDRIDRVAMSPGQPAREIWHYHGLGLRFAFVDRDGLGDFRLVGEVG